MTTTTGRVDKNKSQIVFSINNGPTDYTTMNLATIPNRKRLEKKPELNFSLRVDDIEGASPATYTKNYISTSFHVDDIEGAQTKPTVNLEKPPRDIMKVDDIEGAKPRIIRQLNNSNRMVNPTDPVYQLPSFTPEPPFIPKFIRDTMKNDDVEGAAPKSYKTDKPPRDIMKVDDISGPRIVKPDLYITPHNRNFDVSDINDNGVFKTTRHTNPIFPQYHIYGKDLENDFGIHVPPKDGHNSPFYSLETSDISGCFADSTTKRFRSFKQPPPHTIEDDLKPAEILMVPSMIKQSAELEKRRIADQKRGEKIRNFESRSLHIDQNTSDIAQNILQRQRDERRKRNVQQMTTLTFG